MYGKFSFQGETKWDNKRVAKVKTMRTDETNKAILYESQMNLKSGKRKITHACLVYYTQQNSLSRKSPAFASLYNFHIYTLHYSKSFMSSPVSIFNVVIYSQMESEVSKCLKTCSLYGCVCANFSVKTVNNWRNCVFAPES